MLKEHRPKVGDEVLLRNRLGLLNTYIVVHVYDWGCEVAFNKYSRPVWSMLWSGYDRARAAV